MIFRIFIVVHRWLGAALCLLFLLWFASGIGMMYWGMPSVSAGDRLDRSPVLDPAQFLVSPQEAAEAAGIKWSPDQLRVNSFDGRPVYRFGGGEGRDGGNGEERGASGERMVYADTGEVKGPSDTVLRDRVAAHWSGQPATAAQIESMGEEPDQWTVGNNLRTLRPLWKYSWPDGQQLYIGESGEVLQYTTHSSRLAAYVSAIPHWLYFTSLRQHQPVWVRFTTYSAMVGTGVAIIGVILGVWMYSPLGKKYRYAGAPSSVPYRGQKRWHTILGLVFGIATITWVFSGSLAFLPFPQDRRPQNNQNATAGTTANVTTATETTTDDAPTAKARSRQESGKAKATDAAAGGRNAALQSGPGGRGESGERAQGAGRQRNDRGRRGGGGTVASALRGRVQWSAYPNAEPREFLAQHSDLKIKELAFTSFDSQPFYTARLDDGKSRLFSIDGLPVDGFDQERIIDIAKKSAANPDVVETRIVNQYDTYYLDRTRRRPLPAILVLMHDAEETRYYVDPKTAAVVGNYRNSNWTRRWLYQGLHSLNFPWLYNYRPLWDIVVIGFMLGGTALSMTSLVLAWRTVGKRIRLRLQPKKTGGLVPLRKPSLG